ncbi:MAG TPA: TIGR00159 family protein [Candidatus Egerieisoma faecipullorum]|uniref:Diadenylate cyclase n=1 Tax=Candidatus Egerieisoma faecipullorum TaxID=2840963 RepID=A0A9D1L9U5_9CLOT|nr:TIGR00159 family protein [Candidatus Egerieisoma faecipullorum]
MRLASSEFDRITTFLVEYFGIRSVWDVFRIIIDILMISYVFYLLITLLRDSRAFQLIKGVILILLAAFVSDLLRLSTVSFVLKMVIEVLPVMLIVLFQPELRRILENIGKSPIRELFTASNQNTADLSIMVEEVVKAASAMAEEKTGALIIFERETNLSEVIRTGTIVDSNVSAQLLRLLFVKNTPLHDGAVIIRGNKIYAAACYLPLSNNLHLNKDLGTRHRAGIGISESTDCISVIVSEETGYISMARGGVLTRNITPDILRKLLREGLAPQDKGKKAGSKVAGLFRLADRVSKKRKDKKKRDGDGNGKT